MKHYLLVGASSSIAQSTKAELLAAGHRVTQLSRNIEHSDAEITDYLSPLPQIQASFDGIVYFPGSIHLKPFRSFKLEDFQADYSLHFLGAINVLKTYHTQLNDGGSIVLISSVAATTGMPFHSSVASVKAAIEALGRSLAAEWAPKLRVNVVAPSLTMTPMAEKLTNSPEKVEAGSQRHPLKRLGEPQDLAQSIAFLLGDQSAWITGQTLHVDGGMSTLKS